MSQTTWPREAKRWLEGGLGLLYPPVCQLCGRERAEARGGYVGAECARQVRWVTAPYCRRCGLPFAGVIDGPFECENCRELDLKFRSARAAVVASGMVLEVVHRYKYQQALWFEPFLAGLLVQAARPALAGVAWDKIVPVPLHSAKERERDFNQAARLAGHLAQATGIPLCAAALERVRRTDTQTHLSRRERSANVRSAFRARPGKALPGERIVLVDDVLTTGATTSACAEALAEAGVGEVHVWTVARGL